MIAYIFQVLRCMLAHIKLYSIQRAFRNSEKVFLNQMLWDEITLSHAYNHTNYGK